MSELLDELNEEQKESVLALSGVNMVFAGPGSGKTKSLTTKIAYLIEEENVLPSKIWGCTFTKKAANEMKERLEKIVGPSAKKVKLKTIHSTAFYIIKEAYRYKGKMWDIPQILAKEGIAQAHLYKWIKKHKFQNKDAKAFLSKISTDKLYKINPEQIKKELENNAGEVIEWDKTDKLDWWQQYYLVFKEYERWKKSRNYIDFPDILLLCLEILKDPAYNTFVKALKKKISHFLIDEVQDNNEISFEIANILAEEANSYTIYGDFRQGIYSFQGASLKNILNWKKLHNPREISFTKNYRSTPQIVNNANTFIANSPLFKDAQPSMAVRKLGENIDVFCHNSEVEEGMWVLDKVQEYLSNGYEPRDIFILYRVHSLARETEDNFLLHDIPYVIYSETDFFNRKEIKDMISYLTIAKDPVKCNWRHFKRVLNRPNRFLSNNLINDIKDAADEIGEKPWEVLENIWDHDFEPWQQSRLMDFVQSINSIKSMIAQNKTTKEILLFILDKIGYRQWAIEEQKLVKADDDIDMNFEALLTSVGKFEKVDDFFDFMNRVKEEEKKKKDPDGNFVKMMSIHRSKGLENKIVFVIGMTEKTYPFYKAVEEGNEEEEKRIMYVAMTRPQDKLYFSTIDSRRVGKKVGPSPYLGGLMDVSMKNATYTGSMFDIEQLEERYEQKGRK